MTSISPLDAAFNALYDSSATKTASTQSDNSTGASPRSTSVTLGQSATASPVYGNPATSTSQVWETQSNDPISSLMGINSSSLTGVEQFEGLGAAVLNQIGSLGSNFSQSVLQEGPNANAKQVADARSQLQGLANNQITLAVTLKSGIKVNITLGSEGNGLSVQVKVTGGTLSAADQSALQDLSKGFQSAIDGLSAEPPSLDLGGLTQFDTGDITSIGFQAKVGGQTVDFQTNGQVRSLNTNGPLGAVQVSVDTSNSMIIGNAQQQAAALASYLAQFQYEQSRGQGNSSLMSMFESAFAEMNSNYNVASGNGASGTSPALPAAGQSMLTGLADFTASVTQTPVSSNPYLPDETDTFSFQVSQTSDIVGDEDNPFDIAVKQQQNSHLSASFHKALPGAGPLALTDSINSQNYDFYQIDDSASSDAQVAFQQGKLIKATLDHSASQSTHKQEYVLGQRVQDTTEPPVNESWSKDLLKELLGSQQSTHPTDSLQVSPTLLQVNGIVDLQVDPSEVRLADGQV